MDLKRLKKLLGAAALGAALMVGGKQVKAEEIIKINKQQVEKIDNFVRQNPTKILTDRKTGEKVYIFEDKGVTAISDDESLIVGGKVEKGEKYFIDYGKDGEVDRMVYSPIHIENPSVRNKLISELKFPPASETEFKLEVDASRYSRNPSLEGYNKRVEIFADPKNKEVRFEDYELGKIWEKGKETYEDLQKAFNSYTTNFVENYIKKEKKSR